MQDANANPFPAGQKQDVKPADLRPLYRLNHLILGRGSVNVSDRTRVSNVGVVAEHRVSCCVKAVGSSSGTTLVILDRRLSSSVTSVWLEQTNRHKIGLPATCVLPIPNDDRISIRLRPICLVHKSSTPALETNYQLKILSRATIHPCVCIPNDLYWT